MKVCAIICEYNPLHTGHAYHIAQAREQSGAEFVLCIQSGPFVQRGEAAVVDKWTRAQAALRAGADMVVELPSLFALRAAQDFAFGGVSLADSLSVVTHLSFGTETDGLDGLLPLAAPETQEQSARFAQALAQGNSYPRAAALSMGRELPRNAMLGVEYLRALARLKSPIAPLAVHRQGEGSSSQIRLLLREGTKEALSLCPAYSAELTDAALRRQGGAARLDRLDELLLYTLRNMDAKTLALCPGMEEGLENRVLACAQEAADMQQLLSLIKTKRYTMARLKRSLVHALLGSTKALFSEHPRPEFARVLGFRESALPLLQAMGRLSRIPLILRPAQWRLDPLYGYEIKAQDLWGLCQDDPRLRRAGCDLTEPLVRL